VATAAGVVLPVVGHKGTDWLVSTPCGLTTTVRGAHPVGAVSVVLDPGHGGSEAGAIGPNRLAEKVVNLAVAQQARATLEKGGFGVAMTRAADYRMTLSARARVVTALQPRAFVSVHHNSEPDGPWPRPGTETYYQVASPASKRLAGLVYEEVTRTLAAYRVGWVADTDAGAKYRKNAGGDDYYAMLRQTHGVPSALAELAFISNPVEADLLSRADVQRAEGDAVARGIVRFLTTADPGSGFSEPYPRTEPAGGGGGGQNCVDPPL